MTVRTQTREAISSAQPAGAGRLLDYAWPLPDSSALVIGTNAVGNTRFARGGHTVTPGIAGLVGGTATITWQLYKGRACLRLAGNGDLHRALPWVIPLQVERFNAAGPRLDIDGQRVYRVIAEMASDGSGPAAGGDFGLILYCNPNSANVTTQSTAQAVNADSAGFGFHCEGAGPNWMFRSKTSVVLAADYTALNGMGENDATEWNVFELRLFSATRDQDARVQRYLNGVFVGEHNIGAGVVPPYAGQSFNYLPKIVRTGNVAANHNLMVAGVRIIAGTAFELGL